MIKCPYCQSNNYSRFQSNFVAVPVELFECCKSKAKGVRPDGVEYVECICGTLNHVANKAGE